MGLPACRSPPSPRCFVASSWRPSQTDCRGRRSCLPTHMRAAEPCQEMYGKVWGGRNCHKPIADSADVVNLRGAARRAACATGYQGAVRENEAGCVVKKCGAGMGVGRARVSCGGTRPDASHKGVGS
eukprot:151082-Chlamydomonas_euryale.AAC.2